MSLGTNTVPASPKGHAPNTLCIHSSMQNAKPPSVSQGSILCQHVSTARDGVSNLLAASRIIKSSIVRYHQTLAGGPGIPYRAPSIGM